MSFKFFDVGGKKSVATPPREPIKAAFFPHLLVYLADLFVGTEDELHCAAAGCPNNLLYRSDHTYVWDVLGRLEEILTEKQKNKYKTKSH